MAHTNVVLLQVCVCPQHANHTGWLWRVQGPTQSVPAHLSRDLPLQGRAETEGSRQLLKFGLEIVNPLQAASAWTLAV